MQHKPAPRIARRPRTPATTPPIIAPRWRLETGIVVVDVSVGISLAEEACVDGGMSDGSPLAGVGMAANEFVVSAL